MGTPVYSPTGPNSWSAPTYRVATCALTAVQWRGPWLPGSPKALRNCVREGRAVGTGMLFIGDLFGATAGKSQRQSLADHDGP